MLTCYSYENAVASNLCVVRYVSFPYFKNPELSGTISKYPLLYLSSIPKPTLHVESNVTLNVELPSLILSHITVLVNVSVLYGHSGTLQIRTKQKQFFSTHPLQ